MRSQASAQSAPSQAHPRAAPVRDQTTAALQGRDPAARALALQRTVGNAVVARLLAPQRVLSRSVITIHSPTDAPVSKRITRNCEETLRTRKTGGHPLSIEAPRGQSISMIYARGAGGGPPVFTRTPDESFAADDQTIYILGHGSAETGKVSDLDAGEIADTLIEWFGKVPYTGKIKLVSCTTAADWDIDASGADVVGLTPVAQQLADALRTRCVSIPFKPRSVDGVLGIAWVDDKTGKIVSTDLREYMKNAAAAVDAFKIRSRTNREEAIGKLFGPGVATTGKAGKLRFNI